MSDSVEQFNQVTRQRRRNQEDDRQRLLQAEENEKRRIQAEAEYRKRKRRVVLTAGMVLSVGVLLAMIQCDLIHQLIGEAVIAAVSAAFGYHIAK